MRFSVLAALALSAAISLPACSKKQSAITPQASAVDTPKSDKRDLGAKPEASNPDKISQNSGRGTELGMTAARGAQDSIGGDGLPVTSIDEVVSAIKARIEGKELSENFRAFALTLYSKKEFNFVVTKMAKLHPGIGSLDGLKDIMERLKHLDVIIKTDGKCLDDEGKDADASTQKGVLGAPICVRAAGLRRYSVSDLTLIIDPLLIHELSHQYGSDEKTATEIQLGMQTGLKKGFIETRSFDDYNWYRRIGRFQYCYRLGTPRETFKSPDKKDNLVSCPNYNHAEWQPQQNSNLRNSTVYPENETWPDLGGITPSNGGSFYKPPISEKNHPALRDSIPDSSDSVEYYLNGWTADKPWTPVFHKIQEVWQECIADNAQSSTDKDSLSAFMPAPTPNLTKHYFFFNGYFDSEKSTYYDQIPNLQPSHNLPMIKLEELIHSSNGRNSNDLCKPTIDLLAQINLELNRHGEFDYYLKNKYAHEHKIMIDQSEFQTTTLNTLEALIPALESQIRTKCINLPGLNLAELPSEPSRSLGIIPLLEEFRNQFKELKDRHDFLNYELPPEKIDPYWASILNCD